MAHIHTEPGGHDATVSAFVFRTDFDQPKLLLHWHKKLNKWLQFGGHVERTENPWQAMTHELAEESGYEMSELKILQPTQRLRRLSGAVLHPQPACSNTHEFPKLNHFHSDLSYGFVAHGQSSGEVDEGESHALRLFTRRELIGLSDIEIVEDVREIALFIFDECLPSWEQVDCSEFQAQ